MFKSYNINETGDGLGKRVSIIDSAWSYEVIVPSWRVPWGAIASALIEAYESKKEPVLPPLLSLIAIFMGRSEFKVIPYNEFPKLLPYLHCVQRGWQKEIREKKVRDLRGKAKNDFSLFLDALPYGASYQYRGRTL